MGLAETARAPGEEKRVGQSGGFPADRDGKLAFAGSTGEKENSRGEDPFARRVGVRTISFSFFCRHLIRGAAVFTSPRRRPWRGREARGVAVNE